MIIPENYVIHSPNPKLLKIINNKTFSDKILFEKESTFHNIKIVENEIGRFLHYNDTYQAGWINTKNYRGNLPYINYFLLPYFYKTSVEKVLLIGLGTGQIVEDLFKLYPNIKRFDIVDIEENILEIATKFFNFKTNEKINFYLQDALVYLRNCKSKYDLIIVDVANNEGIDERFLSEDYLNSVKNHLKKNGIFISNLCSSADLEHSKNIIYKKIKSLYKSVFKSNKIYKGNYSDRIYYKSFFDLDDRAIDITNLIILSSNEPITRHHRLKSKIEKFKLIFPNIDISSILHDEVF